MDQRRALLNQWLHTQLVSAQRYSGELLPLETVSGDASFRRYFRYRFPTPQGEQSVIGVDAPPEKEDSRPFVKVARGLAAAGVQVPPLLATDLEQGFMMLGDFGDRLLLPVLDADSVDKWYSAAMRALIPVMRADFSADPLPRYDHALLQREMELFREWFCGTHLQLTLSADEQRMLTDVFNWLEQQALAQPQVTVHRDYHSRNLMVLADGSLGVLDFQDAVHGPITYDLMSLLRDCYISWPTSMVKEWVRRFAERLVREGLMGDVSDDQFWQWFNVMGAQRHLKVCGIFARLNYRDGKAGYLKDIPLTLAYLIEECEAVRGDGRRLMQAFSRWLRQTVVPALLQKQPDAVAVLNERLS
jgi:N-acetylmuramate 1-kinase